MGLPAALTDEGLAVRLDNGMTRGTWIRATAYGYVPPVLPKFTPWSLAALVEIVTRLSIAPGLGVITKSVRNYHTATWHVTRLYRELGHDDFVVKVEPGYDGGWDAVVYSRAYLDSLPPKPVPWHARYSPSLWMNITGLRERLGVGTQRAHQIVAEYGITYVVWNNRKARLFLRSDVDRVALIRCAALLNEQGKPRRIGVEAPWRPDL